MRTSQVNWKLITTIGQFRWYATRTIKLFLVFAIAANSSVPAQEQSADSDLLKTAIKAKQEGKYAECADLLTKAIKQSAATNEQLSKLFYLRGECFAIMKSRIEAYADATMAVELNPNNVEALNLRGNSRIQRRNIRDGIADLEKAAVLAPKFSWPHLNLAEFYAAFPDAEYRNGEKAIAHAQKAVTLAKNNAYYRSVLAAAYAESGMFHDAVATQLEAIMLATAQGISEARLSEYQDQLMLFRAGKPYRKLDW